MPDAVTAAVPDTTGKLTAVQKRNIRRAVGEQAAQMIDDCRQLCVSVTLQQKAMARELTEFTTQVSLELNKLGTRVDGIAAWSAKNEEALGSTNRTVLTVAKGIAEDLDALSLRTQQRADVCERLLDALDARLTPTIHGLGLIGRLRWLLFGTVKVRPVHPAAPAQTLRTLRAIEPAGERLN